MAPTILAIADKKLPPPRIEAPKRLRRGEVATIGLGAAGSGGISPPVFRLEFIDPAGKLVPYYSGVVVARHGIAAKDLALAFNDPVGTWKIRATDVLSGRTTTAALRVIGR